MRIIKNQWNVPSKGNHNWAEVRLDDGTWSFVEPMFNDLNKTWFFPEPAKHQVPGSEEFGIWAATYVRHDGKANDHYFPLAWNPNDVSVPAIDVTQTYLDTK